MKKQEGWGDTSNKDDYGKSSRLYLWMTGYYKIRIIKQSVKFMTDEYHAGVCGQKQMCR